MAEENTTTIPVLLPAGLYRLLPGTNAAPLTKCVGEAHYLNGTDARCECGECPPTGLKNLCGYCSSPIGLSVHHYGILGYEFLHAACAKEITERVKRANPLPALSRDDPRDDSSRCSLSRPPFR